MEGEEEPKKKTARIKIRLSVGGAKKGGGGGEKGGGSVASKSSSTRGKKRKAEEDEETESLEGKQQVKVRVRVNDKPCKEGVCYAQLPSSAVNNIMDVEDKNVKKKGNGGGRKGKRKKEEEEMEESSDDDQVDEIDEDDRWPRKNKKAADNKNKTSFVNLVGLQSVNRRRFTSQHGQRLRHHRRRNIH